MGGDLYLNIAHGDETLRKRCQTGDALQFVFKTTQLRVTCMQVLPVFPISLACSIEE